MGTLDGQVAVITGGGSGIGKAVARAFAKEGCAVAIAGRTVARLDAVAEELRALGGRVIAVPTDVTDEGQRPLTAGAWTRCRWRRGSASSART